MKTLIVEDSQTLSAIYQAYLEGMGLQISAAESLSEAITRLDLDRPELILLDIELPDGNGLDLLAELTEWSPKPVVVVTRSSPKTSSSLSRMRASAVSRRRLIAEVASNSSSPCSVRIKPRAWR